MTSKISFHKLLLDDIKQRGWVLALTSVWMFLTLPVASLIYMQSEYTYMEDLIESDLGARTEFLNRLSGYLTYDNNGIKIAVIILAVICGVSGYVFLHSKEKLDLYHSLPITRGRKFAIQYISGLLIFVVPYLGGQILAYLFPVMQGYVIDHIVQNFVVSSAIHILFFAIFYSMTILAMVLTGRPIIALLGTGVFFCYPMILTNTIRSLNSTFLATYYEGAVSVWFPLDLVPGQFSPLFQYIDLSRPEDHQKMICMVFVITILIVLLSWFLYKKRPSESAERAIAFKKTESVIKVFVAVPIAICIGAYMREIVQGGTLWFAVSAIFSVALLCCVIEFMFHVDLRTIVKRWRSVVVAVGAILLVLGIYRFDLFGYDSYFPKESNVKGIAVGVPELSRYFDYYGPYYDGESEVMFEATSEATKKIMYQMAEEGVEGIDTQDADKDAELIVRYQLKGGRKVYRSYYVDPETLLNYLDTLCKDESMRSAILPIEKMNMETVELRVLDYRNEGYDIALSKMQMQELLETYREEISKMSLKEMNDSEIIGFFETEVGINNWDEAYELCELPIYSHLEETINLAREYGCDLKRPEVSLDEVKSIVIWDYTKDVDDQTKVDMSDTETVQRILSGITMSYGILTEKTEEGISVDIELKNGEQESYYIYKGYLPE